MSTVPLWRKIVAGAAGLLAAAGFVSGIAPFSFYRSELVALAIPSLLLVIAAAIVHRPTLVPQLFARAVWWANIVLGTLFSIFGASLEREAGMRMAIGCCVALLVIGRKGLAEASERAHYAPAAFKGSLLLLMVLAMADAQTSLFGFIFLHNAPVIIGVAMLFAGVAYVVGFVGLLRLRAWGAWVNLLTCGLLVVVVLAGCNARGFQGTVCVLCAVHMLAASPLLLAATTNVRLPSLPARWRLVATSAIVLGLALTSTISCFTHAFGLNR